VTEKKERKEKNFDELKARTLHAEVSADGIDEENNTDTLNETTEQDVIAISLEEELAKKEKECDEYIDMLKRTKAEFDNYRKRTIKEKDSIYDDGFVDGVKQILPIIDNLERAVTFNTSENDSLLEGVEMVLKLFNDTLTKNEVVEIPAMDESFDPHYHNAVMHVEDENYNENVVIEVLQKGYKYKEKVIRYSMVKVAN
jgi:molecular chaperone GrpE